MKVIEICPELDGGGVDRLLYDYCSRIIPEIEFDFIVSSKRKGILEKPLEDLGCKIYHVPQMHENLKEHNLVVKSIFQNGEYDIVHDHSGYRAFPNLKIAKECGIRVRIAHSHLAFIPETPREKLIRKLVTPLTKYYATDLFACGQDAAKWMWGAQHRVYLMRNAIDISKFVFDNEKRQHIRKMYNIENKIVVGNVARFSYQKNHEFLLDVFSEFEKLQPETVLLLVGRGELFDAVQEKARKLGIYDKVIFLGIRDDVPDLLNAMDVFLLPSRYEGLPVTLVEVQANGIPVLASDTITREIKLATNMVYLSIDNNVKEWATLLTQSDLTRKTFDIDSSGYNIRKAAKDLMLEYRRLSKCER